MMQEDILNHPIVKRTIQQQKKGLKKYGTLVTPSQLSLKHWIEHDQEEKTDSLVYGEVVRERLDTMVDMLYYTLHRIEEGDTEKAKECIKHMIKMING